MGRLARIYYREMSKGEGEWSSDTLWLVYELNEARRLISEYERALHQRGHVVELTDYGWAIEHTVECRAQGILNCPIHMKLELMLRDNDGYLDEENGRYMVDLSREGVLNFTRMEEDGLP